MRFEGIAVVTFNTAMLRFVHAVCLIGALIVVAQRNNAITVAADLVAAVVAAFAAVRAIVIITAFGDTSAIAFSVTLGALAYTVNTLEAVHTASAARSVFETALIRCTAIVVVRLGIDAFVVAHHH